MCQSQTSSVHCCTKIVHMCNFITIKCSFITNTTWALTVFVFHHFFQCKCFQYKAVAELLVKPKIGTIALHRWIECGTLSRVSTRQQHQDSGGMLNNWRQLKDVSQTGCTVYSFFKWKWEIYRWRSFNASANILNEFFIWEQWMNIDVYHINFDAL